MERYERDAQKLLRRLGVNGSYKGFWFAAYAITRTIQNPELLVHISKGLYVEIAVHFQSTIGCAERNIRTVRENIWESGDRELLNQIFGRKLTESPNNAAFIDALAEYIIEICQGEIPVEAAVK